MANYALGTDQGQSHSLICPLRRYPLVSDLRTCNSGHDSQDLTIPKSPAFGANDSLPNSQQSSLNNSSNSLLSQTRPSGVSELSQGSGVPRDTTPSTSLSSKSSQERVEMGGSDDQITLTVDDRLGSQEELYTMNTSVAMPAGQRYDHTSAPKRMANGEIKSPGYSLPTSPGDSSQYGHSRNSSRTSRGSQVGEVCHRNTPIDGRNADHDQ